MLSCAQALNKSATACEQCQRRERITWWQIQCERGDERAERQPQQQHVRCRSAVSWLTLQQRGTLQSPRHHGTMHPSHCSHVKLGPGIVAQARSNHRTRYQVWPTSKQL